MRLIITMLVSLFLLSGCVLQKVESYVESSKEQAVTVVTPFANSARCRLTDNKGNDWYVNKTPQTIKVKSGHGPMSVICSKRGFKKQVKFVEEEHVVLDYLDMLEEGIGVAMDPSATISRRYPKEIVMWMEPVSWESEEQLREWSLEKRLYENKQLALQKAKEEDQKRIEKDELELRTKLEAEYRQRLSDSKDIPRPQIKTRKFDGGKFLEPTEDVFGVRPPSR